MPDTLHQIDSRRITGYQRVLPAPGALIDVAGPTTDVAAALERWRHHARPLLNALGWAQSEMHTLVVPGGASLGFTAPIDALYAATDVNECAWRWATADDEPNEETRQSEVARLARLIADESNPALLALAQAAARREVPFLSDDDVASVGLGSGSRSYAIDDLPAASDVDREVPWAELHDVTTLVVTGTNGKTTTVRLLASIVEAAGLTAGFTSTDGVFVAGELVDSGDYSGPGGARLLLRDPRVEVALLETARGGLLRRGLGFTEATAVAVTNVAADHLGEFGVHDVDAIADTKLVVTRAIPESAAGRVVLNADDTRLRAHGRDWGARVCWFTQLDHHADEMVRDHIAAGHCAATLENEVLTLWVEGRALPIAAATDIPATIGGAARHNIANALVAAALAHIAGVSVAEIAAGLAAFQPTPEQSPGRGNFFEIDGVTVYADFAHNPHGFEAMVAMAQRLPKQRIGIVLGQAGDRDDESIREMTRIALRLEPARIVVKEMPAYLRGREPGAVPALILDELQRGDYPKAQLGHSPTESAAVEELLAWKQPGDLLLLPLHSERQAVLDRLAELAARS